MSGLPLVDIPVAGDKLALVIPTLREAENLRALVPAIQAALEGTSIPYEILVVDDDSQDGTEELITAMAQEDPRIRLLVRKGQRGLAGAILHGWQHSNAAILGVMDADLQHPPELLPGLITQVQGGIDLAIGSRYARGGGLGAWSPIRKLISAAAVWVTWPLQKPGLGAKDPMSGFFIVRRPCVEHILFQPTGFKLLLEILVRGRVQSLRELPFEFGLRREGQSKAGLKVAWEYLLLLLKLYAETRNRMPVPVEAGDSLRVADGSKAGTALPEH